MRHLIIKPRQIELVLDVVLIHLTEELVPAQTAKPRDPRNLLWRWHTRRFCWNIYNQKVWEFLRFWLVFFLFCNWLKSSQRPFIRNRVGCKVCVCVVFCVSVCMSHTVCIYVCVCVLCAYVNINICCQLLLFKYKKVRNIVVTKIEWCVYVRSSSSRSSSSCQGGNNKSGFLFFVFLYWEGD